MAYHPTLGTWVQRDPAGYVDGSNVYQYVGSDPVGATDPMGLWDQNFEHPPMTEKAYDEAIAEKMYLLDNKRIVDIIVKANQRIDSVSTNFDNYPIHYNRKVGEDPAIAKREFHAFVAGRVDSVQFFSKRGGARLCKAALIALGEVTHAWQDFFSHAVLYTAGPTQAAPLWWAGRGGTPDNDYHLKPSSYPGEHPRGAEPAAADPAEVSARKEAAHSYVVDRYRYLLAEAWFGECWCYFRKKAD